MTGDTKERILEAALELFAQSGYLGTSMSDISEKGKAEAAGAAVLSTRIFIGDA